MKKINFPMSIRTRVSTLTYERVAAAAEAAGMSVGRFARYKLDGTKVPDQSKLRLMNELRRQGGLMKMLALQGQPTQEILSEIKKTLSILQGSDN